MDHAPSALSLGILGPLEAARDGRRLDLGPFKQRIVLGMLLCRPNKVVPVATLSDAVWQDAVPRTAHKNLQVYVWALRKTLGASRSGSGTARRLIVHRPPGYLIEVGSEESDTLRFAELARAGRESLRCGDDAAAARLLDRALRLRRGPVLADLVTSPAVAEQARRLDERFLDVYEDWAEAKLDLGEHGDVLDGVDELARRYPFRERLRRAQILALTRAGRHTEALAQFDAMRQALARELGLGPSPVLARLYEAILAGGDVPDTATPRRERENAGTLARARSRPDPECPPGGGSHAGPAGDLADVRPAGGGTGPAPDPADVRPADGGMHAGPVRDLADFTGRAAPIRTLLDLFADQARPPGRIAVISGPVGIGKTALAVHCAHLLAEHFRDGWIVAPARDRHQDARPVADILGDLLRTVAPLREPPAGLEERAALFRLYATDRRTLIVLDDVATEAHLEAVLEAIGGVGVDIMVTSRRRLTGVAGVVHLAVGAMTDAESEEFLSRLIGAERIAAEPRAARRLARACDGLPLALRIAGAKLAVLGHVTPARYADRLADDQRLLPELAVGDLQIRTRLATAYHALAGQDQAVLTTLAGLDAPWFAPSEAATVLGTDVGQAEAAVERLIEAHLVEVRTPADADDYRYTLSRFTRVFVHEHTGC